MKSHEIRRSFLDFFAGKGHAIVRSAPVIPADDPTLLFTNAGMNQFKDLFLGKGSRPYLRAADTQKCIRASGKHNDLEDVGRDTYHHTFFEMLGNWSFGDYYKQEAITWAWELMTGVWQLPKDRLYATVFQDDDESFQLWQQHTDIDPSHVLRFGARDNFWEMGETGPCGPCSEIHIDLTPNRSGGSLVNEGDCRVIELWNLVFIQYDRQSDGHLAPLPLKHVDTGMGFERVAAVLQGKSSNYDSDVFQPLFERITDITGVRYKATMDGETDIAMRVLADHARTLTFAITDGAMPSNEGRGYVLRRILRRALRYSKNLGYGQPILHQLVGTIVATMGDVFTELPARQESVEAIIKAEEESFIVTLDRGMELFAEVAARIRETGGNCIPGEEAFKLYDTYGFPFDLTRLMASDTGLEVDGEGFEHCMQQQKQRARSDRREKHQAGNDGSDWYWFSQDHATRFQGYDQLEMESTITGVALAADRLMLVLDRTPFYPEGGGQCGDRGWIETSRYRFRVDDTQRDGETVLHIVGAVFDKVIDTPAAPADIEPEELDRKAAAAVDRLVRQDAERNHTATHLLHAALRKQLGQHVQQKGSMVSSGRLRFDFSHFSKVGDADLLAIEAEVNEQIRKAEPVARQADVPYDDAIARGALAFFGDKYADLVRVVSIPDISIELCGGTHVDNIGRIGLFKIIAESSVAAGVRRIEAVTGKAAEALLWQGYGELQEIRSLLRVKGEEPLTLRIAELLDARKTLEKKLLEAGVAALTTELGAAMDAASDIAGCRVLTMVLKEVDAETLRQAVQSLRNRYEVGAGLLCCVDHGRVSLVSFASDAAVRQGIDAAKLIRDVARHVQGGGGGKPEFATAGGKKAEGIRDASVLFVQLVEKILQAGS